MLLTKAAGKENVAEEASIFPRPIQAYIAMFLDGGDF
jgi:hypothetical protein